MYLCVRYRICFILRFFWNYSDSVVIFVFHFVLHYVLTDIYMIQPRFKNIECVFCRSIIFGYFVTFRFSIVYLLLYLRFCYWNLEVFG